MTSAQIQVAGEAGDKFKINEREVSQVCIYRFIFLHFSIFLLQHLVFLPAPTFCLYCEESLPHPTPLFYIPFPRYLSPSFCLFHLFGARYGEIEKSLEIGGNTRVRNEKFGNNRMKISVRSKLHCDSSSAVGGDSWRDNGGF